MKYSEILERTRVVGEFFTNRPQLAIIKSKDGELVETSASRPLSDKEIMHYVWCFVQFLIETKSKDKKTYSLHNSTHQINFEIKEYQGAKTNENDK